MIETLKEIGMTESEAKVYLALVKLGLSSKTIIINEAKVSPSKIYHLLDKLIDKGLVSWVIKNNKKHYAAAPIERIKDYLENKKRKINEQEKGIDKIIKKIGKFQSTDNAKAEIFLGWKGMETAYKILLNNIKPTREVFILGASKGADREKTRKFYVGFSLMTIAKKAKVKIIFNENSREYVKEAEEEAKIKYNKKFLPKDTSVEIALVEDVSAIVILKEEPLVILIKDKETADSFITYFKELWEIAKR